MDIELNSFADLYNFVDGLGTHGMTSVVYRGVKSIKYELIPRIGRLQDFNSQNNNKDEPDERKMLDLFKKQALPYLNRVPISDWEWLAIAQHYGMPTRLLDWTRNPLTACFFAVENEFNNDSVIYALHKGGDKDHPKIIDTIDTIAEYDPFSVNFIYKVIPPHVTPRITAQAASFTVHPKPREPFKSENIDRLIIPNRIRPALKMTLYKFGIHSAALFPDLGGLSKLIEWRRTKPRC